MPHNLYLHSALVQSRDVTRSREAVAEACHYNLVDSAIAMNCAFLINAAILIVAAATFYPAASRSNEIQDAHAMLDSLLGIAVGALRLRLGAALLRAELDDHRHAGRPDHHGRLPAVPHPALAAAADHPRAGHRAGRGRDSGHGRNRASTNC